MRIQFVGQAPSQETDGLPPFVGRCGKFLAEELMGISQEEMLRDHDFLNVLDRWPGRGVGGDRFPIIEAKAAAKSKLDQVKGRTVVLLGQNVARAFGIEKFQYMVWYQYHGERNREEVLIPLLCVMPHPSGRNRFWNRPENRDKAKKFLRLLAAKE